MEGRFIKPSAIFSLLLICSVSFGALASAWAQSATPSAHPAWVDTAPTERPEQYGRWAQQIPNNDSVAILKFERVTSHDTKNYPIFIQAPVGASPSGQTLQTRPIPGFDTTTNLLGTTSFRSNTTFAQDLAIYVQGTLRLAKRTPFSPTFDSVPWNQVQGGKLKASADFTTVAGYLLRTAGVRKVSYPHPISSFGLVSVHDLTILTGRVHFVTPKIREPRGTPITATFEYSVRTEGATRRESMIAEGCTTHSIPLKLPAIPFGGEAELLSFSVMESRGTSRAAYCD